jgi:hypothetical protein
MIDAPRNVLGLSGDHGWSEDDEQAGARIGTVALMLGHGAYWISVWLVSGLVPLPMLAARDWLARRSAEKP